MTPLEQVRIQLKTLRLPTAAQVLPEIAASLPKPEEMRAVSIGGDGGGAGPLLGFLAGALGLAEGALKKRAASNGAAD